jgi:hypothetical protein
MDIEGAISNGYLRLYCKIRGIPPPPPRCRICKAELDAKYQKRKSGYLCLKCYRQKNIERQHKPHPHAGSRRSMAQKAYPIVQQCQVEGCNKWGIRHHTDYDKPLEIIWLCPQHHTLLHQGKLPLDKICI